MRVFCCLSYNLYVHTNHLIREYNQLVTVDRIIFADDVFHELEPKCDFAKTTSAN